MSPYIFVIATLLAILPILIIFKVTIERIKEDPSVSQKAQTQFMIGVALSEIIPIILVIYAIANVVPVATIEELYLPAICIILAFAIATFFIFLQRVVDVKEDMKMMVNTFTMISLAMTASLPIVSVVGLFLMMPSN